MSGAKNLVRALRHPNYRLFYGGQVASLVGMWLQLTALSWLLFRLTDSAAWVGLLTFAMQGPGLLLGPIAGALADRHDKRRILVIAQAASMVPALVLGLLTLFEVVEPWHVISLAFVAGIARAFEIPTRQSFIFDLVEPEDIGNAIALNSALFNGARLVGPAIAGVLIPLVGEAWCFLLNAASYSSIIVALIVMKLPLHVPRPKGGPSLFSEIGEGLAYVSKRPTMTALLGALAIAAAAGLPYSVLLPSFAARVLGGGPDTYATLQVAVAVGALAAAFALASRSSVEGLERWVVGAGVGFGILLTAVSYARSMTVTLALLLPMGFCFMIQMASTNTLLQTLAPNELRGRIMSLHTSAFLGIFPIASLAAGWLADLYGEGAVLAGGGVIVAISSVAFGRTTIRKAPEALARASGA